jgi:hypothetical protein
MMPPHPKPSLARDHTLILHVECRKKTIILSYFQVTSAIPMVHHSHPMNRPRQ